MVALKSGMRRRAALAACAVMAVSPLPAFARGDDADGGGLTVDASMRARVETIGGQFRPTAPTDDAMVSFRTRVSAEYDFGGFRLGGEISDARAYGERRHSSAGTRDIDALEPAQAYAAFDFHHVVAPGDRASLLLGEYTLNLGSGRVVGTPDFPNALQSYVGGLFDWSTSRGDRVAAFYAIPGTALPSDIDGLRDNRVELNRFDSHTRFFGLSATRGRAVAGASLEAYAYRLAEGDGTIRTRNRRLVTIGARLFRAPKKAMLDFEVEGAVQRGTERATTAASDRTDLDVRAGFTHVESGWTFDAPWAPRVALLFDYASGDGGDPRTITRFDPLFGGRRVDFGPTSLFGPVSRANVVAVGARLSGRPSKRLDGFIAARGLWLASATDSFASTGVRDAQGASGHYAGTMVEARARRWLIEKRLRVEAGAALLCKGDFLRDAPNAPHTADSGYGYLDVSVFL